MSLFSLQLSPASYRGIPFGVTGGRLSFGRRNAVHQYPFRDTIWVEDLGRGARRIQMTGFLVGDDVIAQRNRLRDAAETPGDGELVHPTLGRIQAALLDADVSETIEQRVFQISLTFVEQGKRSYPQANGAGASATKLAAGAADASVVQQFAAGVAGSLAGVSAIYAAMDAVGTFQALAAQVGQSATALVGMVAVLPMAAGSLIRRGSGILSGQVVVNAADQTVQSLVGLAAVGRQAIAAAGDALSDAASALSTSTSGAFAAAVQAQAEAVRRAAATPGDAARALSLLANMAPAASLAGDALVVHQQCVTLMRRAAVVSLCRAAADYRPQTSDDAIALRTLVLDLMNREIDAAGDSGDDAAFSSLRNLRATVTQLLNAQGAALPTLVNVTSGDSMPALVLAQRLYRDASRSDELALRARAIHPAFMPLQFQALSR